MAEIRNRTLFMIPHNYYTRSKDETSKDDNSDVETVTTGNSVEQQVEIIELLEVDQDQVSDTNPEVPDAMASSITLDKFYGAASNANLWFEDFERYNKYFQINDERALNGFPFHLQGAATQWLRSLPPNKKDTLAHLKTAFLEDFATQQSDRIRVFSDCQKDNETVVEFLTRLQIGGQSLELSDSVMRDLALKGLKQKVRGIVTQHDPKTFAEVKRRATLAEESMKDDPKDEMFAKFMDYMKAATLTPSPQNTDVNATTGKWTPRDSEVRRDARYESPRGGRRTGYGGRQSGGYRQPTESSDNAQYASCNNCGSKYCFTKPSCPARNKKCRKCHRIGHFARKCNSGHSQ